VTSYVGRAWRCELGWLVPDGLDHAVLAWLLFPPSPMSVVCTACDAELAEREPRVASAERDTRASVG